MKRALSLFVALLMLVTVSAFAQTTSIPPMMNFQGRLAKPDGTPVPDGNYQIAFSIFAASSGGAALWTQTMNPVMVHNGTFAVLLGNGNPLTETILNGMPYLEIKVGNDNPLPRQQFASVAFAFKANTVPDGAITTAKLADSSVTNAKIASGIDFGKLTNVPASLLNLPFSAAVSTSIAAFAVTNSSGPSVSGTSTNSIGVYGSTSNAGSYGIQGANANGIGVFGSSLSSTGVYGSSSTGTGVYGNSSSEIGVHGASVDSAGVSGTSTNSIGVYGSTSNASAYGVQGSNATGIGVFGSSLGGVGVYGNSSTNTGVYGNSSSEIGVHGASVDSAGVSGTSTNSIGVYGSTSNAGSYGIQGANANGIGVFGSSLSSTGVYGNSSTGTGVFGASISGSAGDFSGKVRMSGFQLSTAPANGYVLTSDASGNGTWQKVVTGTSGVTSLNSLLGAITLAAGSNVTLTQNGNIITISAVPTGNPTRTSISIQGDTSANTPPGYNYVDVTGVVYVVGGVTHSSGTLYLPLASAVPAGFSLSINLTTSPAGQGFSLSISPAGNNMISKSSSLTYPSNVSLHLISNGTNTWTVQ